MDDARSPMLPSPGSAAGSSRSEGKEPSVAKDREPRRRRKTPHACLPCQKAHLTCQEQRPCQRCIRKNITDQCRPGTRKTAKYLLADLEPPPTAHNQHASAPPPQSTDAPHQQHPAAATSASTSAPVPPLVGQVPGQSYWAVDPSAGPGAGGAQEYPPAGGAGRYWAGLDGTSSAAAASGGDEVGTGAAGWGAPGAAGAPAVAGAASGTAAGAAPPTNGMSDDDMSHLIQAVLTGGEVPFGAETSALEYNILSFMLGGGGSGGPGAAPGPSIPSGTPDPFSTAAAAPGPTGTPDASSMAAGLGGFPPFTAPVGPMTGALHMSDPPGSAPGAPGSNGAGSPTAAGAAGVPGGIAGRAGSASDSAAEDGAAGVGAPRRKRRRAGGVNGAEGAGAGAGSVPAPASSSVPGSGAGVGGVVASGAGAGGAGASAQAAAAAHARALDAHWRGRVRAIYQREIEPFHYTEGYHFLLKWAAENYDQAAVLRIVRALALFRPSLIALQMPLTQEDEVFVERSIQRTVLEFEKLISFSGTPTLVWRRTCEICAVGAEFSKLTMWPRHELVGRHIYELFDTDSALDYWEKFALHAFENTHQSIMTVANVRMYPAPHGINNSNSTADRQEPSAPRMMRCAVCYSIKRDVFDLPCLVVANFLPCLG